jgi:3-dehydroquinate synthase
MKSGLTYLKKLELFKELENFREEVFFAVADVKLKNHLPQWIQFSPTVYWLKNPEDEKNFQTYGDICDFFLKQGIQRSSTIYAFGGGATTDLAGFVASTILRGIKWVSIPSTLLGMVDAGIGGKVGINMPHGKNLLGSFCMPEHVYICGDFLTTLPESEWLSGKGEILKYAFLSREVYQLILKDAPIEGIAAECARTKINIVENDFRDTGERVLLNLGHTLGHAFEFQLKIPHGLAVAMGLKYILLIMNQMEAFEEWEKLVKKLQLPIDKMDLKNYSEFKLPKFISYLEQDKKKVNSSIRLVLVKRIGSCYVEELSLKDFKAKIQNYVETNF